MTVTQSLLKLYMLRRRELLKERVPLDGCTVFVHPDDAMDLMLELFEYGGTSLLDGAFMHRGGAMWKEDASVERGTIKVVTA